MDDRDQRWTEAMAAMVELSMVLRELGIKFSGVLMMPEEQMEGVTSLRYAGSPNLQFCEGINLMATMVTCVTRDPLEALFQSNGPPV